jgi:hypothetical protein
MKDGIEENSMCPIDHMCASWDNPTADPPTRESGCVLIKACNDVAPEGDRKWSFDAEATFQDASIECPDNTGRESYTEALHKVDYFSSSECENLVDVTAHCMPDEFFLDGMCY